MLVQSIFSGIGWLQPTHLQEWRKGRVPYLEKVIQASLGKISFAMKCFGRWASTRKLKSSKTAHFIRSKGPKRKAIYLVIDVGEKPNKADARF
jgi:hypothetical protein